MSGSSGAERASTGPLILGHRINSALAAQALNEVVRTEGGAEVTGLRDTFFDVERSSRTLRYRVVADTIYGELRMSGVWVADLLKRLRMAWWFRVWPWAIPWQAVRYLSMGHPTPADVEKTKRLARHRGWLTSG